MGGMSIVLIIMVIGIGGGSFLLGRKMATTNNTFAMFNTIIIKGFRILFLI